MERNLLTRIVGEVEDGIGKYTLSFALRTKAEGAIILQQIHVRERYQGTKLT